MSEREKPQMRLGCCPTGLCIDEADIREKCAKIAEGFLPAVGEMGGHNAPIIMAIAKAIREAEA